MSSIPKINGIGKVKFPKFQASNNTPNPTAPTASYGYDSFTPSFKGGKSSLASKLKVSGMAAIAGLVATSCCKPVKINNTVNISSETNITIDQSELNAYLEHIIALLEENNAQNAAFFAQNVAFMAEHGVNIQTIIDYLANIENNTTQTVYHLQDLVQNSEEIKQLVANIESIVAQFPELMEANSELLTQILAVALHLDASNNANQEAIIALLNQLLAQAAQMNEQQAANFTAILQAMNQMNEQLQAQLLAILNAIQELDANMQAGYQALLAQLNHMNSQMQGVLMQLINQINGIGVQLDELGQQNQAMFNQFMATFNQFSQQIQQKLAQILAQMQNMEQAQQQQFLAILNQLHNMQEAQQQQYINIMNQLQNLTPEDQQILLDILTQLQHMQQAQQQQYLNMMQQLQHMQQAQQQQFLQIVAQMQHMEASQQQQYMDLMNLLSQMHGETQANLLAILAQMVNMQDAQEQQYLNLMAQLQNMQGDAQAYFLEFMAKLTNLENGQQAILNAMQGMNAEILAKFTQALAKLDAIEANQVTQITQLAQIYNAIQNGNAHLSNIDTFLQNLNLGNVGAHLEIIEGLLTEILSSQNTSNNLLADLTETQNFILTVTQALQEQMEQVVPNQEIMNEWLEAIFNKIPAAAQGCNCEECCAQIIEILLQIDEHILDLDWNHEGIDDDLDPLLGKGMKSLMNTWSSMLDEMASGNPDYAKLDSLKQQADQLLKQIDSRSGKTVQR